jgi:inner membrane protein
VDNVTHTLIGVIIGEAAHRFLPPSTVLSDRQRRGIAIGVMAVGGNLPDADVIYTGVLNTPLDYLLHHRGHTHTLIGALGLSLLMFLVVRLWWRYRKIRPRPADLGMLAGLAVLGPLVHIGLDLTNSFGVHPLWPVDDHWYYGDSVYIVEPLLWACAAVLLFVLPGRVPRVLVGVVLAAGVGLAWFSGFVPVVFAAVLTLLTAGMIAVGRFTSPRVAIGSGLAAWLAVTAVLVGAGRTAKNQVEELLADRFPAASTLDTVLTPLPADPACRQVLAVQISGDQYVIRKAYHSLAPGLITAERCSRLYPGGGETSAPLVPVAQPNTDAIAWVGELSVAAETFRTLTGEYCAVRALMQFARAPYAVPRGDGWTVADLRFDGETGPSIFEVEVGPGQDQCPRVRAPWLPPREDVLRGR